MGKPYVLRDGKVVFITTAPGSPDPSLESIQAWHDDYEARMAARDPEAIRYGKSILERRLAKNLGLRELTALTGINVVEISAIERGKRFPTDDERALIEASLVPSFTAGGGNA